MQVTEKQVDEAFAFLDSLELKKGEASSGALENEKSNPKGDTENKAKENYNDPGVGDAKKLAQQNAGTGDMKKGDEESDEEDDMKKAMSKMQGDMDDMKKAMSSMTTMLKEFTANGGQTQVLKSQMDELNTRQFDQVREISKSIGSVLQDQRQKIDFIAERLEGVEKQPLGRKSATHLKHIEKSFSDTVDIKKGEEGKIRLTPSQNRQEIINKLNTLSGIEKGQEHYNEFYGNAVLAFEASGNLSKAIVDDLAMNHNILITQ